LRRRVGPTRAGRFSFRAHFRVTDARNPGNAVSIPVLASKEFKFVLLQAIELFSSGFQSWFKPSQDLSSFAFASMAAIISQGVVPGGEVRINCLPLCSHSMRSHRRFISLDC